MLGMPFCMLMNYSFNLHNNFFNLIFTTTNYYFYFQCRDEKTNTQRCISFTLKKARKPYWFPMTSKKRG